MFWKINLMGGLDNSSSLWIPRYFHFQRSFCVGSDCQGLQGQAFLWPREVDTVFLWVQVQGRCRLRDESVSAPAHPQRLWKVGTSTNRLPSWVSRKCLCALRRTDTSWSQPLSLPLSLPQLPSPSEKGGDSADTDVSSLLMASSAGYHCSTLQTFQVPFASGMLLITAPKTGTEHLSVPSPAGVMVDS